MTHPDPGGGSMTIAVLLIVFTAGAIIPISITWIQSRARMKAIEVLKAYADCKARHHATVQSWPTLQAQKPPQKSWWARTFGG